MAPLRMLAFHLGSFLRTSYFVQLLITSTVSILILQAIGATAFGTSTSALWLRAGMVGTWSVATVAAGLVGFQRFQGTLPHLLMTSRKPAATLAPLIASAASFGLLAFPLGWLVSVVLRLDPTVPTGASILGMLLFWVGCLAISCTVAGVFVLTPNAMTYEGLLVVPLILLSGVFGMPAGLPEWMRAVLYALPTTGAADLIAGTAQNVVLTTALVLGAALIWTVAATLALRTALQRATVSGTLELV